MRFARTKIVAWVGFAVLLGDSHVGLAQTPTTHPFDLAPTTAPVYAPPPNVYWGRYGNNEPEPRPGDSMFWGNRFDLSFGAEGFTAHGDGRDDTIVFVTGAFRYTIVRNLSIGLELGIAPGTVDDRRHHHDDDDNDGIRAVEELGVIRWHFISTDRFSLFIDGGLGGFHASHDFPTGQRRDDWLGVAGGGLTLRLDEHWYLSAGARYARLGDWDDHRHGERRGSDGVQYYGGFSFVF